MPKDAIRKSDDSQTKTKKKLNGSFIPKGLILIY
jgi:hypothetical protein